MLSLSSEETILSLHNSSFRVEGWVVDATYLQTPNPDGEFSFVFEPLEMTQQQLLLEHLESCVSRVKLNRDIEVRPRYENKQGFLYTSQNNVPQVNVVFDDPMELYGRTTTLTGHIQDRPSGEIVLQIDYIDFDDLSNGIVSFPGETLDEKSNEEIDW